MLDNARVMNIIIFTTAAVNARVPDAGKRFQARSPAATRDPQSAAPRSHRSVVCQRQLLRFQGSRPGQVRDASPGAERGPLGDWRRDRFRLLAALLLSSV